MTLLLGDKRYQECYCLHIRIDTRAVQMKDYNYSNIQCEFYRIFGYSANRGVARVWS